MKQGLVKIGYAAKIMGVTVETMRNWEKTGELLPARKSKAGVRYYDVAELVRLGGVSVENGREAPTT